MEYWAGITLKFLKILKWHVRQDGLVFPKEVFSAEPCAPEVLFGKKVSWSCKFEKLYTLQCSPGGLRSFIST